MTLILDGIEQKEVNGFTNEARNEILGGAQNIQSVYSNQQAEFDVARVQTLASPVTLSAAQAYIIYSRTAGDRPFMFYGGFISWDTLNPATDNVTITVDVMVDGSNWENMWTLTLSAAANPLSLAVPSEANSALLNIPKSFMVGAGNGVRVVATKDADTGGDQVISHNFNDGVPRT